MVESATAKKAATGVFLVALAVMFFAAYVFLVFWENTIDVGAGWVAKLDLFYWVLFFGVALLLCLILLLVLYFAKGRAAPAEPAAVEPLPIFEPTGEPAQRPEPLTPVPSESVEYESATPPVVAEADALLVRCTNCRHEFEIAYQTARPVYATCPQCGEEAVLEEGEEVLQSEGGVPVIELEGIGPVFAEKLNSVGILTTEQLRLADVNRLAQQTDIALGSLENWQAQADFYRLKGVKKQLAELLALSGYRSVKELARATPQQVAGRVKSYLAGVKAPPTKTGIDVRRARLFINEAKKLA